MNKSQTTQIQELELSVIRKIRALVGWSVERNTQKQGKSKITYISATYGAGRRPLIDWDFYIKCITDDKPPVTKRWQQALTACPQNATPVLWLEYGKNYEIVVMKWSLLSIMLWNEGLAWPAWAHEEADSVYWALEKANDAALLPATPVGISTIDNTQVAAVYSRDFVCMLDSLSTR